MSSVKEITLLSSICNMWHHQGQKQTDKQIKKKKKQKTVLFTGELTHHPTDFLPGEVSH